MSDRIGAKTALKVMVRASKPEPYGPRLDRASEVILATAVILILRR